MNRHFSSKLIKVLSLATVISFFVGTVATATDTVGLQVSATRTKDTYPTTLVIHTQIVKDQAEASDNLKFQVLDGATLVEEKTVNVGAQKQDLEGKDYIKSVTTKEFTEAEAAKSYTYTVKLFDKDGTQRGVSSVSHTPKSLNQGETKSVKKADGSGKTIDDTTYTYLEPLPGFGSTFDITQSGAISTYVGTLFKLILGIMGVIAVFEIIRLGIQTMSDSFTQQAFAKKRLTNIIAALIIALCSVLILKTINPKLVEFNLGIKPLEISITVPGFTAAKLSTNIKNISGVYCPGSGGSAAVPQIINSLSGKVTYRFGGTGDPKQPPYNDEPASRMCDDNGTNKPCKDFCPAGTMCLQCTSFVQYVEKCAGITTNFYGGSAIIFGDTNNQKEKITSISSDGTQVNGKTLRPGDVMGWGNGQNTNVYTGHIVVYKGGGRVADSNGGAPYGKKGTSLGDLPTDFYFNKGGSNRKGIKTQYIIRIP